MTFNDFKAVRAEIEYKKEQDKFKASAYMRERRENIKAAKSLTNLPATAIDPPSDEVLLHREKRREYYRKNRDKFVAGKEKYLARTSGEKRQRVLDAIAQAEATERNLEKLQEESKS